jgi:hypothetical protein
MPTKTITTYGPGGYDPSLPNGNVIAVYILFVILSGVAMFASGWLIS